MAGPGFAVVDLETTGFSTKFDRIVEIAVVHLDATGVITGAWETLVNPERDLGAQHVHGIRAADAAHAPRFGEVAPHLLELLDGRVIVAHNASFDLRFLRAELQRAGFGAHAELPSHVCTLELARELIAGAGRTLQDCCDAFDIVLEGAHRAAGDARATARLLQAYMGVTAPTEYWFSLVDAVVPGASLPPCERDIESTWRHREAAAAESSQHFLERIALRLPDISGPVEHQDYLSMLDRCLLDRVLSVHEQRALVALADELGIGRDVADRLHRKYFRSLASAAWSDGVLTADEIGDLAAVAQMLRVPADDITQAMQTPAVPATADVATASRDVAFSLAAGDLVVLTGEMRRPREAWEGVLVGLGFAVWPAVTKKVRLVVAADVDSLSGKARKARDYGIPVVDEATLERMLAR